MFKNNYYLAACLLLAGCQSAQVSKVDNQSQWVSDPASYVNPFIGTEGVYNHRQAANVVPGAVVPHGMFNFGPEHAYTHDLLKESEGISKRVLDENGRVPVSPGGYNYAASRVKGFSFTRLSGTGCLGASGDIPVMPFNKPMQGSPETDKLNAYYSAGFSHDNETAVPGFYQVKLDSGINVELSATQRTGIAKFTFDSIKDAKLLFKSADSQLGSGMAVTNVDKDNGEISGYVTSGNFCGYLGEYNRRDYYTLHFVAQIDSPILFSGAWQDDKIIHGATEASGGTGYGDNGIAKMGKGSGVWVTLDLTANASVTMKVGISYVSVNNARENLKAEQPHGVGLTDIKAQAYKSWNKALSKIQVESKDDDKLTTFYTALFHSQFHPNIFSDVNGQYTGFDQKTHNISGNQTAQYANFSGWDVYRSQLQLVSLLDAKRGSDIAQSLFNQANQYNGVWDRWTHNSGPTGVMSGDPSTIAIANFVAFGADDFDVTGAYHSLRQAALNPTALDLSDEGCPVFCRGQHPSLDQWQSLNYISEQSNSWEGASETLEQASADFALSQLARRMGNEDEAAVFLSRSGYWQNLFNPQTGYIQGRNKDGSFKDNFDPHSRHLFVEGSPAQYLWMVPFDGNSLSRLVGGDDVMVSRLDQHFRDEQGQWVLFRDNAKYADVSNQPSIASPWMYLYTGRAYKTQQTVRAAIDTLWHNSTKGIPGQDDLGQMSSWYVFSALGIYPLTPGRADLVLSSPVFRKSKIGNLVISAPKASNQHIYINKLKLNGKASLRSWIDESYITEPTILDFDLSVTANPDFGFATEHRPHSYSNESHYGKAK